MVAEIASSPLQTSVIAETDRIEILKLRALVDAIREALRRSHEEVILLQRQHNERDLAAPRPQSPSPHSPSPRAPGQAISIDNPRPGAQEEVIKLRAEIERLQQQLHSQQQAYPAFSLFTTAQVLAGKIAEAMERDRFIPDLAFGHDTPSLETLDLLKQRFGTTTIFDAMEMPVLAQRSGSYFRKLPRATLEMIQPRLDHNIQRVDRVITVGPAMARRLKQVYHREVEVVLNSRAGAPVERSNDLRGHVGAAAGDVLCLLGNLIAENYGFEEVVAAFAHLPERFKLVNVGGFGGADYEKKTRAMIEDTGYSHRILFGPHVSFDAVPQLFSGADLGIISFKPTLSENDKYALPNRFFDYCAAGLPIFTTNIEDIARYVEQRDVGAVFADLTPELIATTILSNFDNLDRWRLNARRLGEEIRWENAGAEFIASLGPPGLNVAIVIRRDITDHGRTHRSYRSLTAAGHNVRVFTTSGHLPEPVGMHHVVHV